MNRRSHSATDVQIVRNYNKHIVMWFRDWTYTFSTMYIDKYITRAALGAVEPLGRHKYLKHELHAIGPSIKLSKYSTLTR